MDTSLTKDDAEPPAAVYARKLAPVTANVRQCDMKTRIGFAILLLVAAHVAQGEKAVQPNDTSTSQVLSHAHYIDKLKAAQGVDVVFFVGSLSVPLSNVRQKEYVSAIATGSVSYAGKLGDASEAVKAYGDILLKVGSEEFEIDFCGDHFFWDHKRQLKHSFKCRKLTRLILDDLRGISSAGWIVRQLEQSIESEIGEQGTAPLPRAPAGHSEGAR